MNHGHHYIARINIRAVQQCVKRFGRPAVFAPPPPGYNDLSEISPFKP